MTTLLTKLASMVTTIRVSEKMCFWSPSREHSSNVFTKGLISQESEKQLACIEPAYESSNSGNSLSNLSREEQL